MIFTNRPFAIDESPIGEIRGLSKKYRASYEAVHSWYSTRVSKIDHLLTLDIFGGNNLHV